MATDTETRVRTILGQLRSLGKARELFAELNYDPAHDPISRKGWGEAVANALAEDPQIIACHDDFKIIYARLDSDGLFLGDERPVVNKLLRECPYLLCLFTDRQQQQWHFVNIKYDEDIKKRRLFRRITVGPNERLRTATERLSLLDLERIRPDLTGIYPLDIQERHDEAFDVEAVTKQFFDEYKAIFRILEDDLCKQANDRTWAHDYSLQFLNRCMFIYFIQRKGWLGNDCDFLLNFWKGYQRSGQSQNSFVDNWLRVLFFEAFNSKFHGGHNYFPAEIREALSLAPYLNGGLFTENNLDQEHKAAISDRRFEQVLKFLERYNFTIAEDSPLDKEVAVDPEMIGKVYESLVNVSEEVDERGKAGIFYTPRTEIDLMCRLSLADHLANHLGDERKELLNQLVFALEPDEKTDADRAIAEANLWLTLNERLHDITVLDPACGSGSFLVGMLNILDDLQERANHQLGIAEAPYGRKKRIIGQSLYGVDVMEWACHVAELRLWLALIIDAEFTREELHVRREPLLPYFSFKVRCGDSLVQEVGGINLGHIAASQEVPPPLKARITTLKNEKLKFYNYDTTRRFRSVDALENEERRLFSDILAARQHTIREEIKSLRRKIEGPAGRRIRLDGTIEQKAHQVDFDAPKNQKQIENLTAELAQIEASVKALSTAKEVPFVWDIAFVEIFESESKGFDIVMGNPPYVRQEAIADPHLPRDKVTAENKRVYKDKLARSVYQAFPRFFGYKASTNTAAHKIDARSDLYIYFYLHGLSLLNSRGSFCFITSNSWLDVGYGADLQEFLLKHSHVKLVLDNQVRRTFANADVNSVIVLFSAPDDRREWALDETARFVMFRVPFEHILSPVIFDEIEEATERRATKEYRVFPIQQHRLLEDGCEIPEQEETGKAAAPLIKMARYIGNKWGGKYLRGPDIFFTVLGEHGEYFCKFRSLSSHIQRNNLQHLKYVEHTDRSLCPDGFPFLHSVKDVDTIRINPKLLPKVIPCTGQRNAKWMIPDVISNRFIGARLCFFEGGDFLVHDSFFIATLKNDKEKRTTLALLNSTLSLMMLEQLGRRNMGEGVLCIYGPELANHLIVSPKKLTRDQAKYLEQCYEQIADRPIRPIFDEIKMEDRRKLDEFIFDLLRLSQGERGAVYEAVTNLVRNRLSKADSV